MGPLLARSCTTWSVRIPFRSAQLQDADVTVDFSVHTTPSDRVAVVVTQPLTTNEDWQALGPGEMAVFVDGCRQ